MVVQVDTATSVRNDIQAIRHAIDAADHPALMADCIASLGCEPYMMNGALISLSLPLERTDGH